MNAHASPLALLVLGIAAALARADGDDDQKAMQGRWKVVAAQDNGGHFGADIDGKMSVVIDKNEIRILVDGTKAEQGAKFRLDATKSPKQIDFVEPTVDRDWRRDVAFLKLFRGWKSEKDKIVATTEMPEGIYKLDGDKLTLCWRVIKGKELIPGGIDQELRMRPKLFQSHLYYHQFLFELKREPTKAAK
jgi:uncharacterized protein (TIGR03067 family)